MELFFECFKMVFEVFGDGFVGLFTSGSNESWTNRLITLIVGLILTIACMAFCALALAASKA